MLLACEIQYLVGRFSAKVCTLVQSIHWIFPSIPLWYHLSSHSAHRGNGKCRFCASYVHCMSMAMLLPGRYVKGWIQSSNTASVAFVPASTAILIRTERLLNAIAK